jgi:NitT/TauT family transport system substrate-binding protein
MDAKKIIGISILVIIILAGVIIKFVPFGNTNNTAAVSYALRPEPLKITASGGYQSGETVIDGEKLPLVKIPLVTWGGFAGLIAANNGLKANKDSLFYKYGKFVVELIKEENPQVHLQGYANGIYPVIWSTMDMLPLLYDTLKQDKRLIPQVFGVFDWSFGGDGIVVKGNINTPKDLRGKKIVTAGNTPSNFFLLWVLAQSGIMPSEVVIKYVADAVVARDAFLQDKDIDVCVTWSPFIYELTDPGHKSYVRDSKLLITSKDANQLIADCYITRMDFAKEHPEIIMAFSQAMMEGFDLFQKNKEKIFQDMAVLFNLTGGANEASLMIGDVHLANFPENQMFFDLNNSISAYKIFFLSQEYYKNLGTLSSSTNYNADAVIHKKALDMLAEKAIFTHQANTIKNSFNKQGSFDISDLESSRIVLTEDLQIHFPAQKLDLALLSRDEAATNDHLLKKVAEQMDILGTTIVKLVGHLDTSRVEEYKTKGMQHYIEASAQAKLLSKKRAEFVKKILAEKYNCDAERIITEGMGWDLPADPTDQDKNRRVEVKFFSFE